MQVKSVEFYRDVMGMTLIDKLEFPDMTFDLYFLTTLPEGETYPYTPGSDEAHKYLWTMKGATLASDTRTTSGGAGFDPEPSPGLDPEPSPSPPLLPLLPPLPKLA